MLAEPALWHYLGSFVFYTGLVIGLLYLVYGHLKRNPRHRALLLARQGGISSGLLSSLGWPNGTQAQSVSSPKEPATALWVEAALSLGEGQIKHDGMNHHVYVLGVGNERFLLGTGYEGVRCLAKLDETAGEAHPRENGDVRPAHSQGQSPLPRKESPTAPAISDKRLSEVLQTLLTKPRPGLTPQATKPLL